ncbi:P-loop NTPase fold protein [Leptospira noguchii]|uniref:P-loop NTPase fold protein n=1 Tax=Leptospira noguchii TaxID=28182 RepID=UPI0030B8D22B
MVASGIQSSNIWEDDVLGREQVASFLENIIKQKIGNFVLTINSPWGTGKTFLIQRMINLVTVNWTHFLRSIFFKFCRTHKV